jgi:hypothetical protein
VFLVLAVPVLGRVECAERFLPVIVEMLAQVVMSHAFWSLRVLVARVPVGASGIALRLPCRGEDGSVRLLDGGGRVSRCDGA